METPFARPAPRVLIVEDDASLRRLLEMRLRVDGYEVRVAADGTDALDVLASWAAQVIVTDVMMPRMSGLSLCRAVRADPQLRSTPIILLTAACFDADMQAVVDLGGITFMAKPFDALALRGELSRALGLRALLPGSAPHSR